MPSVDPVQALKSARLSVSRELLAYLQRHADAADSLDGILQWWLPRQRYETERQKVEQALERLVKKKLVRKHRLADGTVVYASAHPTRAPNGEIH